MAAAAGLTVMCASRRYGVVRSHSSPECYAGSPHDEVVHLPAAERGFMRQLSLDEAIPQCIERPQVADSTPTRPSASPLPRTTTEFLFPIADVVR